MSAQTFQGLQRQNERYAESHTPPVRFKELPDQKAALVLTCMDPRCNPNEFWQFGEQGPAVVRNGGGRATEDALRSMRVLSVIMAAGRNTLGAVAVVHHTDCGLWNFDDKFIAQKIKGRLQEGERAEVDKLAFGSFTDLEKSVKEDVEIIKQDPFLPKDLEVLGFEYDTFSGKTRQIV